MDLGIFGDVEGPFIQVEDIVKTYLTLPDITVDTNVRWVKLAYQGKILYFPEKPLATEATWKALYSCGLVYGEPGPGAYPLTPMVDQGKTFLSKINGRYEQFRIRLISGSLTDPATADTTGSEWDRLFYRLYSSSPSAIWNFNSSGITSRILTKEAWAATLANRLVVYINGSTATGLSTTVNGLWFPVLEYIESPMEGFPAPVILDRVNTDWEMIAPNFANTGPQVIRQMSYVNSEFTPVLPSFQGVE